MVADGVRPSQGKAWAACSTCFSRSDKGAADAGASRLHAVAWTLWWIAFLAGAGLLAAAMPALRPATGIAWLLVLGLGVLVPALLGAGISQRLAFAAWFAWTWWAAGVVRR